MNERGADDDDDISHVSYFWEDEGSKGDEGDVYVDVEELNDN